MNPVLKASITIGFHVPRQREGPGINAGPEGVVWTSIWARVPYSQYFGVVVSDIVEARLHVRNVVIIRQRADVQITETYRVHSSGPHRTCDDGKSRWFDTYMACGLTHEPPGESYPAVQQTARQIDDAKQQAK